MSNSRVLATQGLVANLGARLNSGQKLTKNVCEQRRTCGHASKIPVMQGMARVPGWLVNFSISILSLLLVLLFVVVTCSQVSGTPVLMRVCDTREVKTVTSRVCMLYKRTKNSDVKLDRQGNLRIARELKGDYSLAKLASDCCKIGCPPHIFANIC